MKCVNIPETSDSVVSPLFFFTLFPSHSFYFLCFPFILKAVKSLKVGVENQNPSVRMEEAAVNFLCSVSNTAAL